MGRDFEVSACGTSLFRNRTVDEEPQPKPRHRRCYSKRWEALERAEFCEARSQLDGRRLRRAPPSIWEPFADLKSAIVDQRLLVGIAA